MLEMKYPAHFVSAAPLYGLHDAVGLELVKPKVPSTIFVAAIEHKLAEASALRLARRYDAAITAYKSAQTMIYRLLRPEERPGAIIGRDDIMLPVGETIERGIVEAGLRLVEHLKVDGVDPAPPVVFELDGDAPALSEVGIRGQDTLAPKVGHRLDKALDLLAQGQAEQAVAALERLREVPEAGDGIAPATLALNLASAHLAAGDAEAANRWADRSAAAFREAGNERGAAGALHNKAVALTRMGDEAAATEAFEASSRIVDAGADGGNGHTAAPPHVRDLMRERDATKLLLTRGEGIDDAIVLPLDRAPEDWALRVSSVGGVGELRWKDGARPAADAVLDLYAKRIKVEKVADLVLRPWGPAETATYLGHLYGFVVPQALGDCYRGLGNHERAEQYYLQAAGYRFLNTKLEAPNLWTRIAGNALEWGDRLFKRERIDDARAVYGRVIASDRTAPAGGPLYGIAGLAGPAATAREVIGQLGQLGPVADPAIGQIVFKVWARWLYLNAGLDFWGTSLTPIFTFEYLQHVARGFAEQSIHAEREYVTFQTQAEAERAARAELEAAAALAQAEVDSRVALHDAAEAETRAMNEAVDMADQRVQNAKDARSEYRTAGHWQYVSQSIATAHGAGEDWHGSEIRQLARDIESGSWEGDPAKLAAAATLLGGQRSYEYQMARLEDQIEEAQASVAVTKEQAAAAANREEAARLGVEAAKLRRDLSNDALVAFENEVFTPELWSRMAEAMKEISESYQEWAIRSAKLMERAYNFERDTKLKVIKTEYPATATGGLLGSDFLLRDVDSFTYHDVAHTRSKVSQLKHVVSLANEHPFSFYELQRTGHCAFATSLRDFEQAHPGFFGQRIHAVEVEIVGLLPPGGPRGSLRGGGTSRYRTADGGVRVRAHTIDTLALSEHDVRQDGFLFRPDPRVHGLFEGHGLATNWELDLPRRSNDYDPRLLADVRLVLHYSAQFSAPLRTSVLERASLPGELVHVRNFLARYDFPEAWYAFLDTGTLGFTIDENVLPRNETNFRTDRLSLRLLGADGVAVDGVDVTITPPGAAAATLKTEADGSVAAKNANKLEEAMGGPLLGAWEVKVSPPAGSPLLDADGRLRPDALRNVAVVVQYGFDWPA